MPISRNQLPAARSMSCMTGRSDMLAVRMRIAAASAGVIVGAAKQRHQFRVEIGHGMDADAVREQGVEPARRLEAPCWADALEDEPDIEASRRRRLDHGELTGAAKADVALLRRLGDVAAEFADHGDELVMDRPKGRLPPGVQRRDRVLL